jgi:hypothetical protein
MTNLRTIFLAIALAIVSMGSYAQTTEQTSSDKTGPASTQDYDDKMGAMDNHMKVMREMHDNMTSAKTPEARQALMAEHMKAIKDGMGMMAKGAGMDKGGIMGKKRMMGGDLAQHHHKMEKRIDQMQSMMQMMMMSRMMDMHSVMGGMGHKHGGEAASGELVQRNQMMDKRMDMMQSMMQMIIDTLEPVSAK